MNNFNIGDKVRVSNIVPNSSWRAPDGFTPAMMIMQGKEGVVTNKIYGCNCIYYKLSISDDYAWRDEWLEPAGEFRAFISFSAQNREEAFQKAKEKIEEVFGPKDWTSDEISAAQTKVIYLASKVIAEGGDVKFIKSGKAIFCKVYKSSFNLDKQVHGIATPKGQDVPNDWIGKCVALCSALHEPIPFFITNKNK